MGGFGASIGHNSATPFLDLGPQGLGDPKVGPWDRVLALMAFPDDRKAQLAHLAPLHARSLGTLEEISQRAVAWLGFAHDGGFNVIADGVPSVDDARGAWTQRAIQGQLAAEVLRLLLARPEPPGGRRGPIGTRQAVHIVGERLSELNAHGIPKSRAAVMQAWKRFKPVAHLWLALRLEPRAERTLGTFLARAEGLRQLARKDASLDSVATWAVPVELIAKLPTVEPALPPLTDTKVVRRHWNTYRSHEK